MAGRANRHGLIAGATGTGKTVTLQGLAEGFSAAGVPVFLADVKGDLAGMAMPGSPTSKLHDALTARAAELGLANHSYADNPVVFWDLFGEHKIEQVVRLIRSKGVGGPHPVSRSHQGSSAWGCCSSPG